MNKKALFYIDNILKSSKVLKKYDIEVDDNTLKVIKKKLNNKEYSVSILGSMKSGKSTFINAILGNDIMPNESQACTFRNTEIFHNKSEDIIRKIYDNNRMEYIEGENISDIFLEEVRKSRANNEYGNFFYELNRDIPCLMGINSDTNFKIVDTPGYNEMSGLGVDRKIIEEIFENQLRKTNYIIYVFDYKYYKSDENIEILNKIKEIRPDLIQNNKICFVLNKIDLISYKDGDIDSIKTDISKLLDTVGIKSFKIYETSAKKAFLSRVSKNQTDIEKYRDEISSIAPLKTIEIDGKKYDVQVSEEEMIDLFINESKISVIEEEIIKELYINSREELEKSQIEYINLLNNQYITKLDEKINNILSVKSNIKKDLLPLQDLHKRLSNAIKNITKNEVLGKKMINIPSFDDAKENEYFKAARYCFYKTSSPRYSAWGEYSSYYSAESEAKSQFNKFKRGLKPDVNRIYNEYKCKLEYSKNPDNEIYKFNQKLSNYLSDSVKEVNQLISLIPNKVKLIGKFEMNLVPQPIMPLTYSNSQEYLDDLTYDNSTFIDIDDVEKYEGTSFWGNSKYKTYYGYNILNATKEEEKDLGNALECISNAFFKDYYYKKYEIYMPQVSKQFNNDMEKILNEMNEIVNYYNNQANKFNNKIKTLNTQIKEILKIYNILATNDEKSIPSIKLLKIIDTKNNTKKTKLKGNSSDISKKVNKSNNIRKTNRIIENDWACIEDKEVRKEIVDGFNDLINRLEHLKKQTL